MKKIVNILIFLIFIYTAFGIPQINFITVDNFDGVSIEDKVIKILETEKKFIIHGSEVNKIQYISFTNEIKLPNQPCDIRKIYGRFEINLESSMIKTNFEYKYSNKIPKYENLYICLCQHLTSDSSIIWHHQGNESIFQVYTSPIEIPLWASIIMLILLFSISGIFSGLNLGLMSLTTEELIIITKVGTPIEKIYAKNIIPLRKKNSVLLSAILISNTMLNAAATVIMEGVSNGLIAVVASTASIVIFGEIVPQSIFSRYALKICSQTRYLTWFVICLTSPFCFPLGLFLDFLLRIKRKNEFSRNKLIELVKSSCEANIEADEKNIIYGGLQFKDKTVEEVMVKLQDCYLIEENAILDKEKMNEIVESGYSRIPVYSFDRENIVAIFHVKDITFVDPNDKIPLTNILDVHYHKLLKVFGDTKLDFMLKEFKKGETHVAIIIDIRSFENKDPEYYAKGLITLEDIIEEILQVDITDETDEIVGGTLQNYEKAHKQEFIHNRNKYFKSFIKENLELNSTQVSTIATFLSNAINCFNQNIINIDELKSLIMKPGSLILFEEKISGSYIYTKGFPADFFILVIEGNVEVLAGMESISFKQGPYSYYGEGSLLSALSSSSNLNNQSINFIPDFSLLTIGRVVVLKIRKHSYLSAIKNQNTLQASIKGEASNYLNENDSISIKSANQNGEETDNVRVIIISQDSVDDLS